MSLFRRMAAPCEAAHCAPSKAPSSLPLAPVDTREHDRAVHAPSVTPDMPVLDPATVEMLRALSGANRPGENILAEFVSLFARDAPARLTLIRDGWQRGQAKVVSDAAHALKGAAATLGALRVHALAHAIDQHAKPAARSGATLPPMTARDVAMVDELGDEVESALAQMRVHFLGEHAPPA